VDRAALMPVERRPVSVSQFSELMGIEPARLVDVEFSRRQSSVVLVLEPEEVDVHLPDGRAMVRTAGFITKERPMTQTSGTCPPLSGNTAIRKPKGGKKR